MTPDLISAEHAGEYRLRLVFGNGLTGVADLRSIVESGGVFERIREPAEFARFTVNRELGVIAWGDAVDIAPETLYHLATGEPLPAWMEAGADAVRQVPAAYGGAYEAPATQGGAEMPRNLLGGGAVPGRRATTADFDRLCAVLRDRVLGEARVVVIAGSGLGGFARSVKARATVPYSDLPGVGASTVTGHTGSLVLGEAAGVPIFLMNGRRHLYEGVSPAESTLLLRALLVEKGAEVVVISNAAGGLNPAFDVGDLMLISDQVNWMFRNPLLGANRDEWGDRFPDLSDAYSRRLRAIAREAALAAGVPLREGVYFGGLGPSYETRAEIAMMRAIAGADAVGMSTVPEALVAAHMRREVLGISFISNLLTTPAVTTHEEVMENSRRVEAKFTSLMEALLLRL